MRLFEFTNAQEQLALLRVIVDNTWRAIEQEAELQARAAAQKAANKPKRSSAGKDSSIKTAAAIPVPKPMAKPLAKPVAAAPAVNKAATTTPAQQSAMLKQQANKILPFNPQSDAQQLAQMAPARL
jgi:hypothetical protein